MKQSFFCIVLICTTYCVNASESNDASKSANNEEVQPSVELSTDSTRDTAAINTEENSRSIREKSVIGVNLGLSPMNVPFPMAWGASGYYIASGNWMFGIDYLNSSKALKLFSFELGEISETNLALQARRFIGNSFNFKFGFGQRTTEVKFPGNLLDLALKSYSETAAKFETKFIRLGIGNQWQLWKRYSLVVDWFSIDIPVSGTVVKSASEYANSPSDKTTIEDAERVLKYFPGGGAFKFDVGIVF